VPDAHARLCYIASWSLLSCVPSPPLSYTSYPLMMLYVLLYCCGYTVCCCSVAVSSATSGIHSVILRKTLGGSEEAGGEVELGGVGGTSRLAWRRWSKAAAAVDVQYHTHTNGPFPMMAALFTISNGLHGLGERWQTHQAARATAQLQGAPLKPINCCSSQALVMEAPRRSFFHTIRRSHFIIEDT